MTEASGEGLMPRNGPLHDCHLLHGPIRLGRPKKANQRGITNGWIAFERRGSSRSIHQNDHQFLGSVHAFEGGGLDIGRRAWAGDE
jgi:hypothetical protein